MQHRIAILLHMSYRETFTFSTAVKSLYKYAAILILCGAALIASSYTIVARLNCYFACTTEHTLLEVAKIIGIVSLSFGLTLLVANIPFIRQCVKKLNHKKSPTQLVSINVAISRLYLWAGIMLATNMATVQFYRYAYVSFLYGPNNLMQDVVRPLIKLVANISLTTAVFLFVVATSLVLRRVYRRKRSR